MNQVAVQIITGVSFIASIFILIHILYNWGQPHIKYLACTAVILAANSLGYFLEVTAPALEAAKTAYQLEYFVGIYLGPFSLFFGLEYIGRPIRKLTVIFSLLIIPILISLIAITDQLSFLCVREMAFTPVGNVYRLELVTLGPFYYIGFAYNAAVILITSVMICLNFLYKRRKSWFHSVIFVFCLWLPIYSNVLRWADFFPEMDFFSVACTASIGILYWYVRRYRQPEWSGLGWEAVIEKINEAVMIVNSDKEIINVNPAFFEFFPSFHYTNQTLLTRFINYVKGMAVVSVPETLFDDLNTFGSDYSEGEFTIQMPAANGAPHLPQTFTMTRQNIKIKEQILGQIIVLSDVSFYRNMIEEIIKLKMKAEEASRSKSDFLAAVSHEIRTPLHAIIGISEIELQKKHDSDTNIALERIYTSGSGLLGIINDILDISKIEAGNLELIPVDYMVSSLVNDTIQLNLIRIGSKPINFELDIDERIPAKLYGDELRVRQILNNLLSNAIKYTQEGKVTLEISWGGENEEAGIVTIRVSDTGQGIKKEDMDKLFSQYGQINARANRNIEGTGLGLSITKELVEMMRGAIKVKSVYGQGSVFTATIWQEALDPAPLGKETAQNLKQFRFIEVRSNRKKMHSNVRMPDGKVLVVDDVETNLYVARGLLKPYGLQVDCVKSGPEAIARLQAEKCPYDIVFMDHMMPGMDGIEAVKLIRSMDAEYAHTLPVVALTANAIVGMREMFLEKGFNDYLSKPISWPKLDAILLKWIPREKQLPKETDEEADEKTPEQRAIEIEGIDSSQGMDMAGGSRASYFEILSVFSRDAGKWLDTQGRRLPSEDELNDFTIRLHALKSAAANIGAAEISQRAAALEKAGRRGDRGAIRELLEEFRTDMEALVQGIREALKEEETGPEENQEIPEAVRETIRQLREALEGEEYETIEELLKQLKDMELNSRLRQSISFISEQVLLLELPGAIAVIDELQEEPAAHSLSPESGPGTFPDIPV
jgi:signal transduction histidine kinase/CheY-like chemotaxis protein